MKVNIDTKPLKDTHKEIRKAILNKLKTSEELKDVRRVVYGEKIRIGSLHTPAIWVVPEPYRPELVGGRTSNHDIRYNFVVLVKGSNPEKTLERAEDLAFTIYDVFMQDRTLGGLAFDVRPIEINPAYEMGERTQVCWSAVTFDFRLKRRE